MERILLTLLLTSTAALAQTYGSGSQRLSGAANFTVVSQGGGPLVYNARTDNCVHGYNQPGYNASIETDCAAGKTAGQFGSGLVFQEGTNDPVPFNSLDGTMHSGQPAALANASFTDPDFGAYSIFVTDEAVVPSNPGMNWSMGSDGGYDAFSWDGSWLTAQNSGSVSYLWHIVKSRFLSHACSPSNPCAIKSNIKGGTLNGNPAHDSVLLDSSAAVAFTRDHADAPNTLYEGQPTHVNKLTITSSVDGNGVPTGLSDSIVRSLLVDFTSDTPVPCSVLPQDYNSTWNGGFNPSNNGSVSMASSGGGSWATADWNTGGAGAVNNDTFILPVNHNTQINATNPAWSSGVVTVTVDRPLSAAGYPIIVQALKPASYNGTFTTVAVTATTVSYALASNPGACTDCSGHLGYSSAGYQATTAGTKGATEPDWMTYCQVAGSTCSDGTATWTNIGSIGGQGPGFDVVNYRPGVGCSRVNTRLGKIYRGHGNAEYAGNLLTDDKIICDRLTGEMDPTCGHGKVFNLPDKWTLHATSQMLDSRYGIIGPTNSGGIVDPAQWPSGGSCFQTGLQYLGAWNNSTQYAKNIIVYYSDGNYYSTTAALTGAGPWQDPITDSAHWKYGSSMCYNYPITWASGMVHPCFNVGKTYERGGAPGQYACDGHQAIGYRFFYKGGQYFSHWFAKPTCDDTGLNCDNPNGYIGAPSPGVSLIPNALCNDGHPTYRNVGTQDLEPVFDPTADVPAWGGVGMTNAVCGGQSGASSYAAAGYNEEVAFQNVTSLGGGIPAMYRFGHNYNTGSNSGFGAQNGIGVISQQGDMLAFTSDFMNSRGDKSGAATCAHPLRGMYKPSSGQTVTLNDTMMPVTNNSAYSIYQATTCNDGGTGKCAEGSITPNWDSACPNSGDTCADGTVVWTNLGPNTCRADIGLMDVVSARAAN